MNNLPQEPVISVGIVKAESISVSFNGAFRCKAVGGEFKGLRSVSVSSGRAFLDGVDVTGALFEPANASANFSLLDVQIGIGFHWDRKERQTFAGALKFIVDGGLLWAVNVINVESYLRCVISSEMSATSSLELLKAHAVTSRSWLMAQVWGKGQFKGVHKSVSPDEVVTWRDREDHDLFDVCADDHCQRYQGVGRVSNPNVDKAVAETRGLLLTYDGEVCDARFSKCCGGVTERFETCWADVEHPYLMSFHDALMPPALLRKVDLTTEEGAGEWVRASPDAFCNTSDSAILSQVLNDYDLSTADFFRWSRSFTSSELESLLRTKGGIDVGSLRDLVPLRRGPSGRICKLRIVGSDRSVTIGKELEIRRLLSPSHLYSSAFVVEKSDDGRVFTFRGAGWGHGVGLCQIGAAVMASRGFNFRSILYHYFRRATIDKAWS
ncbi:MAG: SpoIID/LytB domain-containing protein [Marinilabiliaceae bacterium]